ncbi:vicilin-like seed storage protein At2g18540 [Argentina anserina]|uniref:vicilin-like seed storage protein At2g18540 n=1 Tax=Argentina anserina TaxID=57926 RepID=UPI00217643CB|nr:vicilin-like seed storage protein At2g18540 [Potentilla anserina]
MAKDRNGDVPEKSNKTPDKDDGSVRKSGKSIELSDSGEDTRRSKSRRKALEASESSDDDKRARRRRKRKSRRRYRSSSEDDSDSDSEESDEESGSDSGSESVSEGSESERRRKRRERRRRKEKEERRRREKEKRKRRREREDEKKKKERRKKRKKEKTEKGKKGAVTDSWGKYGIIRETDMWNKRPEFTAWLAEVKQVNLEHLPNWEEKQMFKQFMEDHNTATFPSKKYYSLDAYYRNKLEKEMKKGIKKVGQTERVVFNDEEVRRQEMMRVREKQKEEEVEALKRSMQSGLAQAMKEQAQLREEMAYQYKIGNFEAAAAIQRRLDPDAE